MNTRSSGRRWFFRPRLWFITGFATLALYILAFPFHVEYFTNAGTIFCLNSGNFSVRWFRLDKRFATDPTEPAPITRLHSEQPGWEATLRGSQREHLLWDGLDRYDTYHDFRWLPYWNAEEFGHFPEQVFADNSPRQIAGYFWRCELIVPMWYFVAAPFLAALVSSIRNHRRRERGNPLAPPHP